MTKYYAVNVRYSNSTEDWEIADMADWYDTFSEACDAAYEAFNDGADVVEAAVFTWVNDEVSDASRRFVRNGDVVEEYNQSGERLWI